jgi:GNAT superfamily N-acetyltransferase
VADVRVERVRGALAEPYLDALARIRIEVFREFPYLYDGSAEYERGYLRSYAASARSTLVIALDGAHGESELEASGSSAHEPRVVGVATALPLLDHGDAQALAPALRQSGYDPEQTYYFGESVLQRAYRGRGIGHAFFDAREQAARELGFSLAAFCAVERPVDHPARPHDYVPHDAFWTRRGYVRRADLVARFAWRDLGESHDSTKPMVFWLKELVA